MIIQKKRIRSLKRHFPYITPGTNIIFGIADIGRFRETLLKVGFSEDFSIGDSVLPSSLFGSISLFNAEGKQVPQKDQPMETVSRQALWDWYEWHGDKRVLQSRIVDIPYKRYPRVFNSPPSIELSISENIQRKKVIVSPIVEFGYEANILHIVNLFLEIFGECHIFTDQLDYFYKTPVKRLNWHILPPGKRSWENLKDDLEPTIRGLSNHNKKVHQWRFKAINKYKPNFVALGQAGFHGYVVFGFEDKNIFILESIYQGNATYVFDKDWESLSKKTKRDILDRQLQKARIIHRNDWSYKVKKLISS